MHYGITLGIVALPYILSYYLYSLILFQWVCLVHNSRLSKNPFENFKKRYRATATSMGGGILVVGILFFAINLQPWIVASVIVGLSLVFILGFFIYGVTLSSMVLENLSDKLKAQRFERMVYWITGSMFLSCCCNLIMLVGKEMYIFLLFSLCLDASSLAAVLYMFKDTVRKIAGSSVESSSSRGIGRRVSRRNARRSGDTRTQESIPMGFISRPRVQMSISNTRNLHSTAACTRGRISSINQQRGRIMSIDQPRHHSYMLEQSKSLSRPTSQLASSILGSSENRRLVDESTPRVGSDVKRRLTNTDSNISFASSHISVPSTTSTRRSAIDMKPPLRSPIVMGSSAAPGGSTSIVKNASLDTGEVESEEQWKNYAI
mmetsp:Transcript_7266/g.11437  ORF Transcript_7266/g.11437 Transcript_7266/m.11437 type:complete len:376 (-) Transcript_7266:124-1251(-)